MNVVMIKFSFTKIQSKKKLNECHRRFIFSNDRVDEEWRPDNSCLLITDFDKKKKNAVVISCI